MTDADKAKKAEEKVKKAEEKKAKQGRVEQKYHVVLTLITPMLATCPDDPDLYQKFVMGRELLQAMKKAKNQKNDAVIEEIKKKMGDREKKELAEIEKNKQLDPKGMTIFRTDANGGLILRDFMVRGFFKAAYLAIINQSGGKGNVDKWLFVSPLQIPITRDGVQLIEADGGEGRTLRKDAAWNTSKGFNGESEVCLAYAEKVDEGCQYEFDITVLPLGFDKGLKKDGIIKMLDYGKLMGMGQWRNGSYGRFSYTITEV